MSDHEHTTIPPEPGQPVLAVQRDHVGRPDDLDIRMLLRLQTKPAITNLNPRPRRKNPPSPTSSSTWRITSPTCSTACCRCSTRCSKTPCAAVAAGLIPFAVGTETDGSIVCPTSVNGIVGIKPTVGLVSRSGIIPISKTQDTAGPMARTVKDAAILLGVLAGIDPADAITSESERIQIGYASLFNTMPESFGRHTMNHLFVAAENTHSTQKFTQD